MNRPDPKGSASAERGWLDRTFEALESSRGLPALVAAAENGQRLLNAVLLRERDGDPARLMSPLVLERHHGFDEFLSQLG